MDQEVELSEFPLDLVEGGVHGGVVGDVGGDQQAGADAFGQGSYAPLQVLALVGEGQLGALGGQAGGDAPGDGFVVGDAHDEALLASHQVALRQVVAGVRHVASVCSPRQRCCAGHGGDGQASL